jgi:hypothetical protein
MNLVTKEDFNATIIALATLRANICRYSYERRSAVWDARQPFRFLAPHEIEQVQEIDQQMCDFVNNAQIVQIIK